MHSILSYRNIIPDYACQILKLSRVRSGQSLNVKTPRIFLVLSEIAPVTVEDFPPSLRAEIKHQHFHPDKYQHLGLTDIP